MVRGDPKNDIAVHVRELHHVIDWVGNNYGQEKCQWILERKQQRPSTSE